jgi:hypothetical protein
MSKSRRTGRTHRNGWTEEQIQAVKELQERDDLLGEVMRCIHPPDSGDTEANTS